MVRTSQTQEKEREKHEATHAQMPKLVRGMCERTRNCDVAPQER